MALIASSIPALAAPVIPPDAWAAYRQSFLGEDGRIVDTGNGNISHSEGQGYGLLLAVLADDAANFDRIWSFTRTQLLVRDDGLAAWRWTPGQQPPVTDLNDASDGDILIAYALARGGALWQRPDLTEAAASLADSIGSRLLFINEDHTLLRPAVTGFDRGERADGPVVNLSYWVFEAFDDLAALAPNYDWKGAVDGGKALLASVLSDSSLPPEWLSVARIARPADGFPAEFGYNALRIPLYLLRAGDGDEAILRKMASAMTDPNGAVRIVDLATDTTREALTEPGYRIIPAAVACVLDEVPVPPDLRTYTSTLYYPSTLHLLTLAHLTEVHPECLR
ncbi:glycosyl hydrolase family 8 [Aureimonas sp. ME7]|uniref:glycosyl hydrolase family 8 n=1 Tax=Aureimonas sp. ME7 TaxID=2744252 RepID=UPI001FCE5B65|nr:glycosyl hydrolase family 8 [Aureimonas sp. ME7]